MIHKLDHLSDTSLGDWLSEAGNLVVVSPYLIPPWCSSVLCFFFFGSPIAEWAPRFLQLTSTDLLSHLSWHWIFQARTGAPPCNRSIHLTVLAGLVVTLGLQSSQLQVSPIEITPCLLATASVANRLLFFRLTNSSSFSLLKTPAHFSWSLLLLDVILVKWGSCSYA